MVDGLLKNAGLNIAQTGQRPGTQHSIVTRFRLVTLYDANGHLAIGRQVESDFVDILSSLKPCLDGIRWVGHVESVHQNRAVAIGIVGFGGTVITVHHQGADGVLPDSGIHLGKLGDGISLHSIILSLLVAAVAISSLCGQLILASGQVLDGLAEIKNSVIAAFHNATAINAFGAFSVPAVSTGQVGIHNVVRVIGLFLGHHADACQCEYCGEYRHSCK